MVYVILNHAFSSISPEKTGFSAAHPDFSRYTKTCIEDKAVAEKFAEWMAQRSPGHRFYLARIENHVQAVKAPIKWGGDSKIEEQAQNHEYLSTIQLAKRLGISKSSLAHWRMNGEGPPWNQLGSRVVYDWPEVQKWINAQKQEPAIELPDAGKVLTPSEQAHRFHLKNPHVYKALKKLAYESLQRKEKRIHLRELCRKLRDSHPEKEYRINNSFTPYYARKLKKDDPAFLKVIETRMERTK